MSSPPAARAATTDSIFDASPIRETRQASASGAADRPRSASITASRAHPYQLIRSSSSPKPTTPASITTDKTPPPAIDVPPTTLTTNAVPDAQDQQVDSTIDPELIALDATNALSTTDTTQAVNTDQPEDLDNLFTRAVDIPFQAPLYDATPIPVVDLIARQPLTLQTAIDAQEQQYNEATSNTTSYPPFSLPASQSVSEDTSPITPSDAGQSLYDDSALTSPVYQDEGEGGQKVPAPRVKKSHARKQPEGHIKRARNAFILFRKHITDSNLIPSTVEVKHQNISVVAAKMWREAPQDVRAKFQEMARIEKEEHQRKYPGYRYQPVFRRTDIIRRRVRKDGTEDEKVEAVAEALIQGKAGGDLEKEIKEQALVDESVDISPEGSAARSRSRRRRDPGQLSKGAMRAQKAQQRQKQMRQNLLGHNLLNISLYNAAQQQQQQQRAAAIALHQSQRQQQHQASYSQNGYQGHGMEQYATMHSQNGYEVDEHGRVLMDVYGNPARSHGHNVYGAAEYGREYPHPHEEMYRLPGIQGFDEPAYDIAPHGQGREYYEGEPISPYGYTQDPHSDPRYMRQQPQGGPSYEIQDPYRLPPLQSPNVPMGLPGTPLPGMQGLHARVEEDDDRGEDPRMRDWAAAEQQTPSGHVVFNERLFGGELAEKDDQGLGDFDDAMQQATEMW